MQIEEKLFFEIQKKFVNVYFTQTEEWGKYWEERGFERAYFTDDCEQPKICCWGIIIKKPLIGSILRIEGESYHSTCSEKDFTNFYSSIVNEGFSAVLLISNSIYNTEFEIGVRRAGFIRPLGMSSCPLTICIDLLTSLDYSRNWRREYKKALNSGLSFEYIEKPRNEDLSQFSEMLKEMNSRKKLSIHFKTEELLPLFENSRFKLFFSYNNEGKPIAGRIIYLHNDKAIDVMAANSNEALECGGTYFLMKSILEHLKQMNIKKFDFGRIPPSTHATDGVYQFKRKVKGEVVQYNGDWTWFKHKWIEILFSIYTFGVSKSIRY